MENRFSAFIIKTIVLFHRYYILLVNIGKLQHITYLIYFVVYQKCHLPKHIKDNKRNACKRRRKSILE